MQELEAFIDRFNQNTLLPDEQLSYNIWTSVPTNPDPSGFEFDTCQVHKNLILRLLYGQVASHRNEYYCFENCEFGTILLKTKPIEHYLQIVYSYLSGCSESFSLYGDADIIKFMEHFGMYFETEEEQEDELFFIKKCISVFYAGQMQGMTDNRKEQDKEREEKQKSQEAKNKKTPQY